MTRSSFGKMGTSCTIALVTGSIIGTTTVADASPVTLHVDAGPFTFFDYDPTWLDNAKTSLVDGTFVNMANGAFPGTQMAAPEDFMLLDGTGNYATWLFWVEDESVESLADRLQVKVRWNWNGEWQTFAEGGGTTPDSPEEGWMSGFQEDYAGGTFGYLGYGVLANQQNYDMWYQSILDNMTTLEGMVRYREDLESDWQIFSLPLQVVPAPGALPLLAASAALVGMRKRRRDSI